MARGPGVRLLIDPGGGTLATPVRSVTTARAAPFLAAAERGPRRDRTAAPAAGALRLGRALEEARAVVVQEHRVDPALACPDLHRGRMGAEQLAHLRQGQEAANAQAGEPRGEAVLVALWRPWVLGPGQVQAVRKHFSVREVLVHELPVEQPVREVLVHELPSNSRTGEPPLTVDWYWEGNVVVALARALAADGWTVRRTARAARSGAGSAAQALRSA
jgi:hypothetical protein